VDALIVHARAAILGGLSPKENREIPPLKYHHVHRLKRENPSLPIVINGGFSDPAAIRAQIDAGLDGVMIGRAAYHRPALLGELETALINPAWASPSPRSVVESMVSYARRAGDQGVRLHSVTRHMQGLLAGREGARAWRRFLAEIAGRPEAVAESLVLGFPLLDRLGLTGLAA
jgi:tRNA-dihydrouridine synthase A